MRVKRVKHCKKHLLFYKTTFGFHEPYQILVDMTFCQLALLCKINIREQINNYIGEQTQLFTTKCILDEGVLLGPRLHGAHLICKQYKLRKCQHPGTLSAQECIANMIGENNSHHLFVATQDHELQMKLKKVPAVPVLRIHYHALVLEKPSRYSLRQADMLASSKSVMTSAEKDRINELKVLHSIKEEKETLPKVKKKKGVNPLAMKKKKKKDITVGKKTSDTVKVRKRKKKKVALHVLEELQKKSTASTSQDG